MYTYHILKSKQVPYFEQIHTHTHWPIGSICWPSLHIYASHTLNSGTSELTDHNNTKQRKASKQTDRQKPLSLNSESFWILLNGMSNNFWLNDEWLTWYGFFFQNPWEIISWLFLFLKRCSAWLLTFSVTWIPYL